MKFIIIGASLVGAGMLAYQSLLVKAEMVVWATGDAVKVRPKDAPEAKNDAWDGDTKVLHLYGARNEYVSGQVVIHARGKGIPAVTVSATELALARSPQTSGQGSGPVIPRENVSCFREHYLRVTVPSQFEADKPAPGRLGVGRYPDPLVPLDPYQGQVFFAVPANENQPVWIDVYIPPEAAPGDYEGHLLISAKEVKDTQINLKLTVWGFTLPHQTHFKNYFYYGPEQLQWGFGVKGEALGEMENKFYQMAHQHRINLASECYLANGQHDWAGWWARYGRYIDGSAYTEGAGQGASAPLWPVMISTEASEEDFKAACRSIVNFFEAKNLRDRLFLYLVDEPGTAEAYETIRRCGRWVDESVGNKLPVMVTEAIHPERPEFGSLVGYVDIWNSGDSTLEEMEARRLAGDRTWVYNGGIAGQPYIDMDGLAVRTWAWATWRFRLDGWQMWDACYWVQKHYGQSDLTDLWNNPLTFDETLRVVDGKPYRADWALRLNGDGVFFYPGHQIGIEGPISCFRAKAFRRGAQDYEYFYLLTRAGRGRMAQQIVREIMPELRQWTHDPAAWERARRRMGEELDRLGRTKSVASSRTR